jgi:hypothetical protein
MKRKSQEDRIFEWLKKGKTLTPLQALQKFCCFRLSSRIYDLKKDSLIRHFIEKEMITTKSGKRVARYRMV